MRFAGEKSAPTLDDVTADSAVVELVAGPGFRFAHQTVVQMNFRRRYGGVVLGIWRQGQRVGRPIRNVQIRPGDVLVVRVPIDRVGRFARSREFILIGRRPARPAVRPHMVSAVLILGAVVALAAAKIAPIAVTAAAGAILMLVFRVLPYDRLYTAVEWRTVVLIGTLLPLGDALTSTGLADLAAQWAGEYVSPLGPLAVLAGLFVATALVTQLMSNAAAVVLIAPFGAADRRGCRNRPATGPDDGGDLGFDGIPHAHRSPGQPARLQRRRLPVRRLPPCGRAADALDPHHVPDRRAVGVAGLSV